MKATIKPYVTQEELEKPRSPAQMLSWVECCLSRVCMAEDGKNALRFRKGNLKYLVEEAYPLGIFARHYFGEVENVQVSLKIGSQPYDASIFDHREKKGKFSFIEITQAHEGEDAHLRMIALERFGYVSALGKVEKHVDKRRYLSIEVESKAMSHSAILEREVSLIKEAIRRKSSKRYPNRTALVVVFDDYIAVRSSDDIAAIQRGIQDTVQQLCGFRWLSIVGWSTQTFIDFDISGDGAQQEAKPGRG